MLGGDSRLCDARIVLCLFFLQLFAMVTLFALCIGDCILFGPSHCILLLQVQQLRPALVNFVDVLLEVFSRRSRNHEAGGGVEDDEDRDTHDAELGSE